MSDPLDQPIADTPPEEVPQDLMNDFVTSLTTEEPVTPEEEPEKVETPEEEPETPEEEPETPETPEEEPEKPEEEPEKPEEEPEEEPETPSNRKDWDILRSSRDRHKQSAEEAKQALTDLETENARLKAETARIAEMEEKLKDFDAYEKELAVTRLEVTREYKENILKPLQVIGNEAETLAKANESETDKVYEMLREADPATQRTNFKEITAGWDEVDRAELWSMAKDARVVLDKQDAMRENASAAAEEQKSLAETRQQQEKEISTKEYVASVADVVKSLREKTPFVAIKEGETEDDRYSAIEAKVAAVDFDAQPTRAKAFAAATAIIYPRMKQTIEKLQEEVASLTARVKETNSKKPTVQSTDNNRPAAEQDKDFLEALGVPSSPMLSQGLNVVGE